MCPIFHYELIWFAGYVITNYNFFIILSLLILNISDIAYVRNHKVQPIASIVKLIWIHQNYVQLNNIPITDSSYWSLICNSDRLSSNDINYLNLNVLFYKYAVGILGLFQWGFFSLWCIPEVESNVYSWVRFSIFSDTFLVIFMNTRFQYDSMIRNFVGYFCELDLPHDIRKTNETTDLYLHMKISPSISLYWFWYTHSTKCYIPQTYMMIIQKYTQRE